MARKRHAAASIYCRFENRFTGACPRQDCQETCPLRLECPAYGIPFRPAVAPPGVAPHG